MTDDFIEINTQILDSGTDNVFLKAEINNSKKEIFE